MSLVIRGLHLPKMLGGEEMHIDIRIFSGGDVIMATSNPPYYKKFQAEQIQEEQGKTFGDLIRQDSNEELAEKFTLIGLGNTPEYLCVPKTPIDEMADYWLWLRYLDQEAPAPQKKEPICLSCAHASFSVTDDFADCLCKISGGCEGGKTECKDYERKGV